MRAKLRVAVAVVVGVVVLAAVVTGGNLPTSVRAAWESSAAQALSGAASVVFEEDFGGDLSKWTHIGGNAYIDTTIGNRVFVSSESEKGTSARVIYPCESAQLPAAITKRPPAIQTSPIVRFQVRQGLQRFLSSLCVRHRTLTKDYPDVVLQFPKTLPMRIQKYRLLPRHQFQERTI